MTAGGVGTNGRRPLLLYVHVPFCKSKCHFCDWVTGIDVADLRVGPESSPRRRYIDAMRRQIAHWGPLLAEYTPELVFWGGGTASLLTPEEIRAVWGALEESFDLANVTEATIESSPDTLDADKLNVLLELGFDRISVGLQSLDDERLRRIGRTHDASTGAASVRMARDAGFRNVSIDLITGMPGQSVAEVEASVRRALDLPIDHVSLYAYRPSGHTVMRRQLERGFLGEIDLGVQLDSYAVGRRLLEDAGLPEYGVSMFGALPCLADLAYFQLRMDWIGFGSGAFSMLDGELRSMRRGGLHGYIEEPVVFDDALPAGGALTAPSLMYLSLTTREGVARRYWEERTRLPLEVVLEHPEVRSFLERLGQFAEMESDADGLRVVPEQAAEAFIRYTHLFVPANARAGAAATASSPVPGRAAAR